MRRARSYKTDQDLWKRSGRSTSGRPLTRLLLATLMIPPSHFAQICKERKLRLGCHQPDLLVEGRGASTPTSPTTR